MKSVRRRLVACLLFAGSAAGTWAQQETRLFDLNAYAPLPSPDGRVVAYVLTGRRFTGGSGGLGRSNLESVVRFCSPEGKALEGSAEDSFLGEWLPDSSAVVGYRDWKYALLSPSGSREAGSLNQVPWIMAERVAYLPGLHEFTWLESTASGTGPVLQSAAGPIAVLNAVTGVDAVLVPSPDGRYLALGETSGHYPRLWIYDLERKTLTNLGSLRIHPDPYWDYIKPGWNPWFANGKLLAFFSEDALYVSEPDGHGRREVVRADHGGLAIPSPDGTMIAYVTFSPRPRQGRPDLNAWGGSLLWVVSSSGGVPRRLTEFTEAETYDVRWLTARSLIFDRISEGLFNEHASIWTVPVSGP